MSAEYRGEEKARGGGLGIAKGKGGGRRKGRRYIVETCGLIGGARMAKKGEQYSNRVVTCAMVGTFGLFVSQWFGDPIWRAVCVPLAFVLWFIIGPQKKQIGEISEVLKDSGLSIKKDKVEVTPHELWRRETENGYEVGLSLPTGMSSSDFIKRSQRVGEALNADVKFRYEAGKIVMDVVKTKLPKMIEYQPIKYELPNVVPIGQSLNGFETLTFGNEVSSVLVAGTSGSGKSSLLKLLIGYWMKEWSSADVELYLADLKWGVEFGIFEDCETVKGYAETPGRVIDIIDELIKEAERRYRMFKERRVWDVIKWNRIYGCIPIKVLIVDEFASLAADSEILGRINRLGAIGRAAGIYGIYSTQYPLAEVVPSGLKFNCQGRMAFRVKTAVNSTVILDAAGAEKIENPGRAILSTSKDIEVQVPYIDETTLEEITRANLRTKENAPKKEKMKGGKGGVSLADWERFRDNRSR